MKNFQRGFYESRLGIPALGPQTRAQANRVIEALKQRGQTRDAAHAFSLWETALKCFVHKLVGLLNELIRSWHVLIEDFLEKPFGVFDLMEQLAKSFIFYPVDACHLFNHQLAIKEANHFSAGVSCA
jgi:hypothetical protein